MWFQSKSTAMTPSFTRDGRLESVQFRRPSRLGRLGITSCCSAALTTPQLGTQPPARLTAGYVGGWLVALPAYILITIGIIESLMQTTCLSLLAKLVDPSRGSSDSYSRGTRVIKYTSTSATSLRIIGQAKKFVDAAQLLAYMIDRNRFGS